MYISRYLEEEIMSISKTFKVLYLGGPRQVGKTTMLSHLAEGLSFNYVSLDDIALRQAARSDPRLFIEDHPTPLIIDEVQYAPDLLPFIKLKVDQSENKGQYWLTGSQQFEVMKEMQESLAGRVGIVNLLGFSLAEVLQANKKSVPFLPQLQRQSPDHPQINDLFSYILKGFYPSLYHDDAPRTDLFYSSYLQTYIDRDLRDIFGINKIEEFHRFVQLCAARTAQVLSYSELARDAGISVNAAKEWINILQSTMQIYLLQPYHANFSKRLIKSPKLYFMDTGFAAYLTRWKTVETLKSGAMAGAFFETLVLSEIVKSYLYRGQEPPLFYFRDKEGHEVDLLIEGAVEVYPVEIKLASQIKDKHLQGIKYFAARHHQTGCAAVASLSPNRYRVEEGIEVVPVGMIN